MLQESCVSQYFVVLGVATACLSTALGSMFGSARIMQAAASTPPLARARTPPPLPLLVPSPRALIAPRRLTIAGAVHGSGKTLTEAELKANFKFTRRFYMGDSFTAIPVGNAKAILRILK